MRIRVVDAEVQGLRTVLPDALPPDSASSWPSVMSALDPAVD